MAKGSMPSSSPLPEKTWANCGELTADSSNPKNRATSSEWAINFGFAVAVGSTVSVGRGVAVGSAVDVDVGCGVDVGTAVGGTSVGVGVSVTDGIVGTTTLSDVTIGSVGSTVGVGEGSPFLSVLTLVYSLAVV